MSNPKERFLKLFYVAMQNFEDETGVEIHAIKIERIDTDDMGAIRKTTTIKYDLELR